MGKSSRTAGFWSSAALLLTLAAGCSDPDVRKAIDGPGVKQATAAATATPGTPAHDLYAERGFTCEACHPCGVRSPDGHAQRWMDQASPEFHAVSANLGLASCRTCHGANLDGVGGSTGVSCAQCHGATWKTDCTMCHGGGDDTTGAPPKATWGNAADAIRVGAHTAHVAAGHALAQPVACASCHAVPADALSAGHADSATATVTFTGVAAAGVPAPGPAWDRAQATCSSNYCHGATLAGGTNRTPVWTAADGAARACDACHGAPPPPPHVASAACGSCHPGYAAGAVNAAIHVDGKIDVAALTCSSCHGSAASPAPPVGTRGETLTTSRAVGAHQAHLSGGSIRSGVACAECHLVPAAMTHADGAVQLAFGPLAGGASASFDAATLTCSTYCHGAFPGGDAANAPIWTRVDGTQAACGTCHGTPPPPPHTTNALCDECHAGYGAGVVDLATHLNGRIDVSASSCDACHGTPGNPAPPVGTGGETAETSRAVGAHQKHLAGGSIGNPVACTECHVVPTAMDHFDGTVQLAFGPFAAMNGATPAWNPASLTCSSTYCHGSVLRGGGTNQAPLWTGGPAQASCGSCHLTPPPPPHPRTQLCDSCHPGYTVTSVNLVTHINGLVEAENLTCSACHGDNSRVLVMQADPLAIAAPPYGSRGETDPASRSVGQHQAHVNRGNGLSLPNKCRYCHAVPTTFDHANGVSQVTFDSLATMDDAAPTFDGSTCSNTYCHGSTLGRGGTNHSPTWTSPAAVTCGSCHGVPPPSPHPQDPDCIRCHPGYTSTSVRRSTHVNGISDFPSGCNSCHDIPPSSGEHLEHLHHRIACDRCHAGYTPTTANETLHRNARQDVTLAGWDATRRTCSSIGCHGSEYWGRTGTAARQSCNQCHGVPPGSGEHFEHSEYACSRCHGTGYSTTTTNPATHMSGAVDVPFAFYDRTARSCSSGAGACHGSERWGTPQPVTPNCANCHGFPPSLPHPQDSACQSCHPSMQSTGVLTADHNDGTLDIAGAGCAICHGNPPVSTRSGGLHPADSNCYGCHSTTVDAQNQIRSNGTHNDGYVQVGGGGVGTYGCQSCHGDPARQAPAGADPHVKAAPPLGTRGETEATTRAVGAHLAHVSPAAGTLAGPARCDECHLVPAAMDHANGTTVLVFGGRATLGGAAPAWDAASVTCSSTYCHGSTLGAGGTSHAPSWTGGPAQAACGTCHGAPPPSPHTASTACGGCHEGYTPTTVNLATHVNGSVEAVASPHPAGWASRAQHGTQANLTGLEGCRSCHALTGPSSGCTACHASAGFASWDTSCTFCHGSTVTGRANPPVDVQGRSVATNVSVGMHESHATTVIAPPLACTECHPGRTASVATDAAHVDGNGIAEVQLGTLARTGGASATYTRTSATSASCSSTYCHGRFSGGTGATVSWTATTQVACTSCHGNPPGTGRHSKHSGRAACTNCHNEVVSSSGTITNRLLHVNGADNVKLGGTYSGRTVSGTWNASTRTCSSLSCHGSESW